MGGNDHRELEIREMAAAGAVLGIVRALAQHRERKQLFAAFFRAMHLLLPATHTAVILVDDAGQLWDFYIQPDPVDIKSRDAKDYKGAQVLETGVAQVLRRDECLDYPVQIELWDRLGAKTSCAIPLRAHDRVLGALVHYSPEATAYDHVDLELLGEIGAATALIVEGVLAYEKLAHLREQTADHNAAMRAELRSRLAWKGVIGDGLAFRNVKDQVLKVGPTDATVLLLGESGTGKDVVARAIHDASARAAGPFLTVNCAALTSTLVESELFGHEQGSFTGALRGRIGRFEQAAGGTLFLDEVGELPLETQAKLLRVLQERRFERVGGTELLRTDVRIVAATNRDLAAMVKSGEFREDLFYRLSVFPITLPPLRERRGDIPLLVDFFVQQAAERMRVPRRTIAAEDMRALTAYEWPGNIRELRNAIERAMIVSRGDTLDVSAALPKPPPPRAAAPRPEPEREQYRAALESCNWVIEGPSGAAARLGVHPNTLRYRLKRLGLSRPHP